LFSPGQGALARDSLRSALTKERFYFVMADRFANGSTANDTGGLTGSRMETGFDPTDRGFYHGGDLKGLTDKLDYIKGLGTTAIWMTPAFKNRPVQGTGDNARALSRLLDHRLHPDRPAPGHER
jgi:glycosidase